MKTYYPIVNEEETIDWIDWLEQQRNYLSTIPNWQGGNSIFGTPEGDVSVAKDLVGNLLALLTNQSVTI